MSQSADTFEDPQEVNITSNDTKESKDINSNSSSDSVNTKPSLLDLRTSILLCFATSFSGFIFGWDVGTIGGISNMDAFKSRFAPLNSEGIPHFPAMIIGLIIAVFNAGCAIGGLTLAKTADIYGRKVGILISIIIYVVGVVVQMSSRASNAWYQLLIGRIVTGLAVGSTSVICPMFISESAPTQIRGAMVVLYQLMITFGILFGNITNYGCKIHYGGEDKEWMIPIGLCFVWAFLVLVGLGFMPESPVYLIEKNNDRDKAKRAIARLNCVDTDSFLANSEVEKIVETSRKIKEEVGETKWSEFLTGSPKLFLRLVIGMFVMAFQQFSGANYFFYYGTSLFSSVGLDDSYITAIILAAVNFGSTFGGVYFVEKLGRKICLLIGSCGMFSCMIIYASLGSFALRDDQGIEKKSVGSAMIVFTCIYIFFFATTWGPVTFVVVSELYPVRVRAVSMAVATSMNWVSNFLISLFTPFITKAIGFKYGYVFSGCLLASAFFVHLLVPETKGLNTQEIDELYSERKAIREKADCCGLDGPNGA